MEKVSRLEPDLRRTVSSVEEVVLNSRLPGSLPAGALMAWARLHGFISFKLVEHYRDSVIDPDRAFRDVITKLRALLDRVS